MESSVTDLVALLDLEQLDANTFRAASVDTDRARVYGGQILAQALMAAGRTVEARHHVHSMHAYFQSTGNPSAPMLFVVDRVRASGSFTLCGVVVEQLDRTLLHAMASFHVQEDGPESFDGIPRVPAPDEMVPIDDWVLARPEPFDQQSLPYFVDALEFRQSSSTFHVDPDTLRGELDEPSRDVWVRARATLPDSPLLHACVIAYASDKPMLGTTVLSQQLRGNPARYLVASLDHSMWFHRFCRADEWMLFRLHSATTSGARAFARCEIFQRDGTLAVSATQEGLVRPLRGEG